MLENPKLFLILIFSLLGSIFLMIGIGIRMNYKKKVKYCNIHTLAKVIDNIRERMQSDDSFSHSSSSRPSPGFLQLSLAHIFIIKEPVRLCNGASEGQPFPTGARPGLPARVP